MTTQQKYDLAAWLTIAFMMSPVMMSCVGF